MRNARAVFWLGRFEDEGREGRRGPKGDPGPLSVQGDTDPAQANTLPTGLDRQVIDDAIRLFDEAFQFFDQRGDLEAQRMIDTLALSLVNLIRAHILARQRR